MTRRESHGGVRTIIATIDRAAASPHNAAESITMVNLVASAIVTLNSNCERFNISARGDWSDAGIRAVVIALAANAPAAELRAMVRVAKSQFAWVEYWDREGCIDPDVVGEEAAAANRAQMSNARAA